MMLKLFFRTRISKVTNLQSIHLTGISTEKGFTLIELAVAALLGTAIISVLLLFLQNILQTDRKESAKSDIQQDIQAALSYISDDIAEAVYIYDADGIEAIGNQLPYGSAASTPARDNQNQPVLAFWKRTYYAYDDDVSAVIPPSTTAVSTKVNCVTKGASATCSGSGIFSYSLVVYYAVKDGNTNWSNAARIARWELKEGFKDPFCPPPGTTCAYVSADPGYQRFNLDLPGDSLSAKMNLWVKAPLTVPSPAQPQYAANYTNYNMSTNDLKDLVDFIDDTSYTTSTIDDGTANNFPVEVPIRPNASVVATAPLSGNLDCINNAATGSGSQRVPGSFSSNTYYNSKELTSFYACVNSNTATPIAKIYIRGNALTRIANVPLSQRLINDTSSRLYGPDLTTGTTMFPTLSTRVIGRGVQSANQ